MPAVSWTAFRSVQSNQRHCSRSPGWRWPARGCQVRRLSPPSLFSLYVAGAAIPGQGGFRSRYFADAAASGAHERSIEYPDDAFTRIDGRLQFDSSAQFPLPFFNDNSRFNFYKVGEPNRRLMDFAVRWSGLWWVDRERPTVYLDAPGATSEVFVDGQSMMALGPSGRSPIVLELPLAEGWHRLDVAFSSPYGGPRISRPAQSTTGAACRSTPRRS